MFKINLYRLFELILFLHPLPSASCLSYCVSPVKLTDGRGEMGRVRSQIIRRRESLVLYKSFNTLWVHISHKQHCSASQRVKLFNDDIYFFSSSVIFPPRSTYGIASMYTQARGKLCGEGGAIPRKIACFQPCKILGLASIRRGENITIF
jgi:hypothetical protein